MVWQAASAVAIKPTRFLLPRVIRARVRLIFKVVQFTSQITSTSNKVGVAAVGEAFNADPNAEPTLVSFQGYFSGYMDFSLPR